MVVPHETELAHNVIRLLKDKYIVDRHPSIKFHPCDDSMTDVRKKKSSMAADLKLLQDKLQSEIYEYRHYLLENKLCDVERFDKCWKYVA